MTRLVARATLGRGAALLALAGAAFVAGPSAAVAASPLAPIDISITDPSGDQEPGAYSGFDITAARIIQERNTGILTATLTFAGDQTPNVEGQVRVGLGMLDATGYCQIFQYGAFHMLAMAHADVGKYALGSYQDISGIGSAVHAGPILTMSTPPVAGVLTGYGWRCARVSTEPFGGDGSDYDVATGVAPIDPTVAPVAVPAAAPGASQPILDADGDGIRDGLDSCPTLAGAASTGCETTPAAKALRLGTKRLVIDRLMDRSGKACPASVKVTVTLRGRRLGAQLVGTTAHGKFCQVVGVVKLKKRSAKARVVITGDGVTPVAATVAR